MKKSKATEAQIIFAFNQDETETTVAEVCRKMGISDDFRISVRRASALQLLARATFEYKPKTKHDEPLQARIRDIAITQASYGFWQIYILLRREGWIVNHKRVYRLYKLEGLNLRSKRPRRNRAGAHRMDRVETFTLHQSWSMDFVADQLFDGRKFRALIPASL